MKTIPTHRFRQFPILLGLLTALMGGLASCSSSNGSSDSATESDAVQVGVLVIRDIETTRGQYEPILDYLSKQTGRPFVLVPLAQESQFLEVEQGKIDFIISNPLASVQIRRLYDTEFVATQSLPGTGTQFAGQIIVRSDSSINQIEDLRGTRGACVSLETAAAGCLFQVLHVQENGLNPFLDFESLVEVPSQNTIVQNVISGDVDFGFVRTGQLENMVANGLLTDTSQVKVLDSRQDEGFTYEHTTRLYPTWPISATSSAAPAVVQSVTQALLNIPADSPALESAGIESFVSAVDYDAVDQLVESLQ
ncbi:MAG: phosphate/phosphite/phosphonate ABC transporter substrate-binding protein, partial [Leptolyngbya sp. SIO1D8]|nr:phosphate/phosphite/phosphonate ABC transporter substrate-binding protein [Leptolyngbya sp. SIO1D8]